MDLPECQEFLLEKIYEANSNTIVVLTNGSAVTMPWVNDVPCILEGWLGGQCGGSAVADIIFGEVEPCGKLAQTFPIDVEDVPAFKWAPDSNRQVQYRENINVGYRYYNSADTEVLFPFGHGLSYTTFEYSALTLNVVKDTSTEMQVDLSVTIRNTGTRPALKLFSVMCTIVSALFIAHFMSCRASRRCAWSLTSKVVRITLDQMAFRVYDVGIRTWIVEPGNFEIQVGASSRDIRLKGVIQLTSGSCASGAAKIAHPNKAFPIDQVLDSDAGFTAMLGYDIPIPPAPTGLFDYNTLVGEIKTSSVGSKLVELVEQIMRREMDNKDDPLHLYIQRARMHSMPLRALVVYSRGMISFEMMDLLLSVMNGEYAYAKALCMAPVVLLSWLIQKCCGVNNRV
ncbi:Fibronectin type III-like domain [Fragilaria crotonensis]|nr:Fibronectin type III-like domain [Fragilaria crotonensis]